MLCPLLEFQLVKIDFLTNFTSSRRKVYATPIIKYTLSFISKNHPFVESTAKV